MAPDVTRSKGGFNRRIINDMGIVVELEFRSQGPGVNTDGQEKDEGNMDYSLTSHCILLHHIYSSIYK